MRLAFWNNRAAEVSMRQAKAGAIKLILCGIILNWKVDVWHQSLTVGFHK